MGEKRNMYRLLVGKPEGGRPSVGGWIMLRWISQRWHGVMWTGTFRFHKMLGNY
jgi:hypothetical protein